MLPKFTAEILPNVAVDPLWNDAMTVLASTLPDTFKLAAVNAPGDVILPIAAMPVILRLLTERLARVVAAIFPYVVPVSVVATMRNSLYASLQINA